MELLRYGKQLPEVEVFCLELCDDLVVYLGLSLELFVDSCN